MSCDIYSVLFLMICGVLFGRNKIVFFCNRNFDLCYTRLEDEFKSLFTQFDVTSVSEVPRRGIWAECKRHGARYALLYAVEGGEAQLAILLIMVILNVLWEIPCLSNIADI